MNSAESSSDRRKASRAATDRPAMFFSAHASLPRSGRVVNISLGGVGIITASPAPVGAHVDLEIQPRPLSPGSPSIYVRGEVVRVSPATPREFLMAVHLRVAPPESSSYDPERVNIGQLLSETVGRLREETGQGAPVAFTEFQRQEREFTGERTPTTSRRRRLAPLLLLVLALLLLGWWLLRDRLVDRPSRRGVASPTDVTVVPEIPTPAIQVSELIARAIPEAPEGSAPAAPVDPSSEESDPGGLDQVSDFKPAIAMGSPLALGQGMVASGELAGVEKILGPAATGPGIPPVERVQAALGLAQAAWARGDPKRALRELTQVEPVLESADPLWGDAAAAMREDLKRGGEATGAHVLADALALAPAGPLAGEGIAAGAIALSVDKSAFVLRVLQGDAELARFPVGLGMGDSTPVGEFVVANMMVNPTWFNRGEAVAPDDPRNPLGSRWMGLGKDGHATSYGIHGTIDPASIGEALSRGCVRMRPGDAEALFAMCSVGTRVTIVP